MTITRANLSGIPLGEPIDWAHVYLLVWWTPTGERRSTSWMGERPMADFIVVGTRSDEDPEVKYRYGERFAPPIWWSPIPAGFQIFRMPDRFKTEEDKVDYATLAGGVYAMGWIMAEPVDRTRGERR